MENGPRGRLAPVRASDLLAELTFDYAVVLSTPEAVVARFGSTDEIFAGASVTKIGSSMAVIVAIERGYIDLDEPAGPPGSTVRHLLAHTSGVPFDAGPPIARPGQRRIYSNYGIEILADMVEEATGVDFPTWKEATVLSPLHLSTVMLQGSAAHGGTGSAEDLAAIGRELMRPTLISEWMHQQATTVQFPGLPGVLPGYGRQERNDWGLGLEIRDHKTPHWTGTNNSPATFGHFGQAGSFLWVDPAVNLSCAFLSAEPFGEVHKELWTPLNDALLKEYGR